MIAPCTLIPTEKAYHHDFPKLIVKMTINRTDLATIKRI